MKNGKKNLNWIVIIQNPLKKKKPGKKKLKLDYYSKPILKNDRWAVKQNNTITENYHEFELHSITIYDSILV